MGSNKRYAKRLDALYDKRTEEMIMRDHRPQSLKSRKLELDEQPLTRAARPLPVTAWVHFGSIPLKVAAEAVTWTPKAVGIYFTTPQGVEHKVWVWASAVERRDDP